MGKGIFIEAGQTVEFYRPLDYLIDEDTGKPKDHYEVKFVRKGWRDDWAEDKIFGYDLQDRLPDSLGRFETYLGSIRCKDVIEIGGV